jgi:hypothetical protein
MEYFSNPPGPCPSERLPKPKEIQQTDQKKRKLGNDEKGLFIMGVFEIFISRSFFSYSDKKRTTINNQ